MADPPSELGGFHQNSMEPSCARGKETIFGAVGTVAMLSIMDYFYTKQTYPIYIFINHIWLDKLHMIYNIYYYIKYTLRRNQVGYIYHEKYS